jgi:hypothetical protein
MFLTNVFDKRKKKEKVFGKQFLPNSLTNNVDTSFDKFLT